MRLFRVWHDALKVNPAPPSHAIHFRVGTGLDDLGKFGLLRVRQPRWRAGGPMVEQTIRISLIVPVHPVPKRLTVHAANRGGVGAAHAVKHPPPATTTVGSGWRPCCATPAAEALWTNSPVVLEPIRARADLLRPIESANPSFGNPPASHTQSRLRFMPGPWTQRTCPDEADCEHKLFPATFNARILSAHRIFPINRHSKRMTTNARGSRLWW